MSISTAFGFVVQNIHTYSGLGLVLFKMVLKSYRIYYAKIQPYKLSQFFLSGRKNSKSDIPSGLSMLKEPKIHQKPTTAGFQQFSGIRYHISGFCSHKLIKCSAGNTAKSVFWTENPPTFRQVSTLHLLHH